MKRPRTRLPRDLAQTEYIRAGELQVFRQLERDARQVDASLPEAAPMPLGPFARVQADAVVDGLGKTRGAINNLWGSQDAFRASIMTGFLNDTSLGMDDVSFPLREDCADLDDWLMRLARVEIERGPRNGASPTVSYGFRWAAWLGLAPYGLWSAQIADPSLAEFRLRVDRFAQSIIGPALEHFGLKLDRSVTLDDLSLATVSTVEGFWLNCCLTQGDPLGRPQSMAVTLGQTLRMLYRGAIAAPNAIKRARSRTAKSATVMRGQRPRRGARR